MFQCPNLVGYGWVAVLHERASEQLRLVEGKLSLVLLHQGVGTVLVLPTNGLPEGFRLLSFSELLDWSSLSHFLSHLNSGIFLKIKTAQPMPNIDHRLNRKDKAVRGIEERGVLQGGVCDGSEKKEKERGRSNQSSSEEILTSLVCSAFTDLAEYPLTS